MAKNQVNIRSLGDEDKLPPSFNYEVSWATPEEKSLVLERMKANSRQTMNFRLMPTAKMILLKDLDNGDKIVGWEGLDHGFDARYPEVFSQFVQPEYRSFLLGVALSHACASFFQTLGLTYAYLRMESATNDELFKIRTESKIYEIAPESALDPQWKSMCQKCELYQTKCMKQAYLRYKVADWVDFGNQRLGIAKIESFPQRLELKPEMLRVDSESRRNFKAKWAA